tara:strand:- start:264 stop:482 length:219 start_codon:yes stop_codon:yes gene_type:complete
MITKDEYIEALYIIQEYSEQFNLANVSKCYSEDDVLNAAKYGYEYRDSTSYPNKDFDSNCKNNVKQWLTTIK